MTPISLNVRADLFHVVRHFTDTTRSDFEPVFVEPLPEGGVALIATDGLDFIVVPDPTGFASRRGAIVIPPAMSKRGVDLARQHNISIALRVESGWACLEPDQGQNVARDVDRKRGVPDWRRMLMPHAQSHIKPPIVADAGMCRQLSDATYGLARAANAAEEVFELCGGLHGATVATFPCWPNAVAFFGATPERDRLRKEARSAFAPAPWMYPRGQFAVVEGAV